LSDDDREEGEKKAISADPPKRRIRHIQPLGMRVLVRIIANDERSPGGLFLPAGVAEKHQEALYGEVIEVARTNPATEDEPHLGENVSGVPSGSQVLFPKDAGVRVPWDSDLRVIDTKEVLAVVEEFDYDQAH